MCSDECCTHTTGTSAARALSTRTATLATTSSRLCAPPTTSLWTSMTSNAVFGRSVKVVMTPPRLRVGTQRTYERPPTTRSERQIGERLVQPVVGRPLAHGRATDPAPRPVARVERVVVLGRRTDRVLPAPAAGGPTPGSGLPPGVGLVGLVEVAGPCHRRGIHVRLGGRRGPRVEVTVDHDRMPGRVDHPVQRAADDRRLPGSHLVVAERAVALGLVLGRGAVPGPQVDNTGVDDSGARRGLHMQIDAQHPEVL